MAAVFVRAPCFGSGFRCVSGCSVAGEVLERFTRNTGDFYIVCNGRIVDSEEQLQNEAVYHLEPKLRGGKGGFGSMLRALGAQIEKTTNREACRDLSGRRLRDVNHEKEMAEWLKKQSEREAEKEQRRLERIQKKLAEPRHQFTDSQFTQTCHELSERLEDSVLKGLQASSFVVKPEVSKRPLDENGDGPETKKIRASCSWTGLNELLSSDEDLEEEEEPGSSTRRSNCLNRSSPGPSQTTPSFGSSSAPGEGQDEPGTSCRPEEDEPEPVTSCRPEEDQKEPVSMSDQTKTKPVENCCRPEPDQDSTQEQHPLDLDSVSRPEDLEVLGLTRLKEELMRRGLKCGGTLSERAARLFSIKGKRPEEIQTTLLAKTIKKQK